MPVSLKDQIVLVVGASSGIGRETAVLFAREGARVVASARREDRLIELRKQLRDEGATVEIFAADASKTEDMDRLASFTRETFGVPDVLVYVTDEYSRSFDEAVESGHLGDDGQRQFERGLLHHARAAGRDAEPALRAPDLRFLGFRVGGGHFGRGVSGVKRGMIGLSHAIRLEEKENGIRTCVVCPGLVDTEILEKRPVKPTEDMLAKAMQPEDVAEVILSVAKLPARVAVPEVHVVPSAL